MGTGSYQFDPINKHIHILSGSQNPLDALDIYDKTMDWADESGSIVHDPPMGAIGKAPLGGGAYSDSIFILSNGWHLQLYDGNYQFTIVGTVITDDASPRMVQVDTGSVEVIFQVSSQGIQLPGAGLSESDKTDIAGRVWTNISGSDISTRVDFIRKVEGNKWKILNNQFIIYDIDGITELKKFDLKSKTGQPTEQNVYERVPV